jgi:hypothetical protein
MLIHIAHVCLVFTSLYKIPLVNSHSASECSFDMVCFSKSLAIITDKMLLLLMLTCAIFYC